MPNVHRFTNAGLGVSIQRKAKTNPSPLYLGIDSNKRPIKTAYVEIATARNTVLTSEPHPTGTRYRNYLPQLRAQRMETAKENYNRLKFHKRLEMQREAEESALNQLVMEKVQRMSQGRLPEFSPILMGLREPEPRLLYLNKYFVEKGGGPKEILSLFRAPPGTFSDSESPVVQIEMEHRSPHTAPPTSGYSHRYHTSMKSAKDVSKYLKKHINRHH